MRAVKQKTDPLRQISLRILHGVKGLRNQGYGYAISNISAHVQNVIFPPKSSLFSEFIMITV